MIGEPVALDKAYLLLNHGPVTLVTSGHAGRRNVMAASWAMPLDFDPPKVVVVIDRTTLTRELVEGSGSFALNIPPEDFARTTHGVGNVSGRDGDKFADFGLETVAASLIEAPLLAGCVAWLECRVIPEARMEQTYDLFVAEVVAAYADPAAFKGGRWLFSDGRRTLHYVAGGQFFKTGAAVNAAES
jgi:flavin reductase (DIM6/NTAB) family NADH-FMN oxidoreductase RutF